MPPDLVHTFAIAAGGAAGASGRASCYVFAARVFKTGRWADFPHGTYLANVLGSLLLGLLTGLALSGRVSADVRDAVGTGFCGALTTFSTFSSDGRVLIEKRRWRALLAHLVVNLGVGFGAAALGYHLGRHA